VFVIASELDFGGRKEKREVEESLILTVMRLPSFDPRQGAN
jgi:hypothetical protein